MEVRLRVEKLINRTIMLTESDISLTGQSDNMTYRLNPTQIDVTIQGLAENINGVVASQLGASLNLSGMTAGSNRGVLKFADSSAYRIVSYSGGLLPGSGDDYRNFPGGDGECGDGVTDGRTE